MKIKAVSGDVLVYLVVGLATVGAVWYVGRRAGAGVSAAVAAVMELPGKAVEAVGEAAQWTFDAMAEPYVNAAEDLGKAFQKVKNYQPDYERDYLNGILD